MAAYAAKMLREYEHDSKIVITKTPDVPYFAIEGNRKQRRSYSSKKLRLKGLRP
jgi:hypothetical protein